MGMMNRVLLFLAALLLLALSVLWLAVSLGAVPDTVWQNELLYALSRKEGVLAAAVILLLSVHLLGVSVHREDEDALARRGEFLVVRSETGSCQVSLAAVRDLVDRTVREARAVRDVKVKPQVRRRKDKKTGEKLEQLELSLLLTVGREARIPALEQELEQKVAEALQRSLALTDVPLAIRVTDITDAQPVRTQRVV
ncbi:MAG: alkaline shock response membrane anchor protein AmaP [Selenomonadaceae bacterium]|nr:alkaline shock response membrane anchor protein AmaP [Selenomonadaceae bacterium]MDY2685543.1 alkaline shock response membrane anchor protein AmaP [Selenomonadaceae bacterium]